MGCLFSARVKVVSAPIPEQEEVYNNKAVIDGMEDPAPPADVDPRLPINAREVFKLKASWKGIRRQMEATGIEMFIRLFRANRDIQKLFPSFADVPDSEIEALRQSEILEGHAKIVMGTMDTAITNIENVDLVLSVLAGVSSRHVKFAGFTAQLFKEVETPFLEAVKLTLADRYSEQMDRIYRIVLMFVIDTLIALVPKDDVS